MENEVTGYSLSRAFFEWTFENPSKVSPSHVALYFFIIEHCNRLGWKREFGLPSTMAMEAIGIKTFKTYIATLNDLIEFGFIQLIEKSRNQYTSNIVALVNFTEAHTKALTKATLKHYRKQDQSTIESIDSIDKHINNITINKEQENGNGDESPTPSVKKTIEDRAKEFGLELVPYMEKYGKSMVREFFDKWTEKNPKGTKMRYEMERTFEISKRLATWKKNEPLFNKKSTQKLNEDGEPIDIVKKYELRNQQLRDANR